MIHHRKVTTLIRYFRRVLDCPKWQSASNFRELDFYEPSIAGENIEILSHAKKKQGIMVGNCKKQVNGPIPSSSFFSGVAANLSIACCNFGTKLHVRKYLKTNFHRCSAHATIGIYICATLWANLKKKTTTINRCATRTFVYCKVMFLCFCFFLFFFFM